jgi:broad specificity phosphatase PhoE
VGTLHLVRHGQASAFAKDYDKLSVIGEQQARRLGEWFARRGVAADAIYVGPRVRHVRTAELAAEGALSMGVQWPASQPLDELDEARLDALFGRASELAAAHPRLAAARSPQVGVVELLGLWIGGELHRAGAGPLAEAARNLEPWTTFRERVGRGLDALRAGPRGRRVLAFTSGGPIAAMLQIALRAPDDTALDLMCALRNASVSELAFSGERLSISSFNAVPHLDLDEHLTLY